MDAQRAMAESERTRKGIETKLVELGRPGTVRFVRIPEPPGGAAAVPSENASTPAPPRSAPGSSTASAAPTPAAKAKSEKVVPLKINEAEFKNDPLIKAALEMFKGHLANVQQPGDAG